MAVRRSTEVVLSVIAGLLAVLACSLRGLLDDAILRALSTGLPVLCLSLVLRPLSRRRATTDLDPDPDTCDRRVAAQLVALKALQDEDPASTGLASPPLSVRGRDRETCLYGDAINRPVLESSCPVWALDGGVARHTGKPVPATA